MIKKIRNCQSGMTYVELIVVLGIFGIVSSITMFDYNKFQDKIDIRVLSNDIALKLVEAQKSSMSGKWNTKVNLVGWKPSYGVYFNANLASNNNFIYFVDLDNDGSYDISSCSATGNGECLEQFSITKGNTISSIGINSSTGSLCSVNSISLAFKRPQSTVIINPPIPSGCNMENIQINISSPNGVTSFIKVFPSGRIQIR